MQVGEENMVQATHGRVVEAIKSTLKQQEEAGVDPVLKLKVGVGMVQQICQYQYESTEDSITQVSATCQDSSYTYSLPSQVSVWLEEVRDSVSLMPPCPSCSSFTVTRHHTTLNCCL